MLNKELDTPEEDFDERQEESNNRRSSVIGQILLFRFGAFLLVLIGGGLFIWLGWLYLFTWEKVSIGVITILVAAILMSSIHIIEQHERAVIYFVGKYRPSTLFFFKGVRGPGLFLTIPFLETIKKVEQIWIRRQPFIAAETQTLDQVPLNVNGFVYYHIEPEKTGLAVYNIEELDASTVAATEIAAKDMIGQHPLDTVTSKRVIVAQSMRDSMTELVKKWGVEIDRVALTDVVPKSRELQLKLSAAAEAEYEARARLKAAQMEVEIAAEYEKAAEVYKKNPHAYSLRQMSALLEVMAQKGASTIVLPSPISDALSQIASGGALKESVNPEEKRPQ